MLQRKYIHRLPDIVSKTIKFVGGHTLNGIVKIIELDFTDGSYCYLVAEDLVTSIGILTDSETCDKGKPVLKCLKCGEPLLVKLWKKEKA